jgi:hypothetical protein
MDGYAMPGMDPYGEYPGDYYGGYGMNPYDPIYATQPHQPVPTQSYGNDYDRMYNPQPTAAYDGRGYMNGDPFARMNAGYQPVDGYQYPDFTYVPTSTSSAVASPTNV